MIISARLVLDSAFPKPGTSPGDLWGLQEALPLFQREGFLPFSICWVGIKAALCRCLGRAGWGWSGGVIHQQSGAGIAQGAAGTLWEPHLYPKRAPTVGTGLGLLERSLNLLPKVELLRENVVASLDPALRDPSLLSWEFSWSIPARREPTSFSQGSAFNLGFFLGLPERKLA